MSHVFKVVDAANIRPGQWYGGVASVAPFRMGKRRSSCYDVLDARRLFTLTIVLSCCAVRIELILVKR
jgi:hypothetical protein